MPVCGLMECALSTLESYINNVLAHYITRTFSLQMIAPVVVLSALSAVFAGNVTTVTGTIVSSIEDCSCTETPTSAANSSVPVAPTSAPAVANGAAVKGAAAVAGVAAVGAYFL